MKIRIYNLLLAAIFVLIFSSNTLSQPYYKIYGYAEKGGLSVQVSATVSYKVQASYPSCTITVYNAGTTNLSTIYSDSLGTPKSNPFTAGTDASFNFYGTSGNYDIKFSGTGITTPFTLSDVIISSQISSNQLDALNGTYGSPSNTNRYVTDTDVQRVGFHPWKPQGTILSASISADEGNLGEPSVIYDSNPQVITNPGVTNVFKMIFASGWFSPNLYYAESIDGVKWIRRSGAVIASRNRFRWFKEDGVYYGFGTNVAGQGIDRFTSTNGITWTLTHTNVLTPGALGTWEGSLLASNEIIVEGSTWYMLYDAGDQSTPTATYSNGLATSTNLGITWTKDTLHNPVVANSGRLDVVKVGNKYYAWGQYIPPTTLLPTDIKRWESSNNLYSFTASAGGNFVFPRHTWDEGAGNSVGQVADLTILEVNNRTYLFYTGTIDGSSSAGGSHIKLAIADMPISRLVETNEGIDYQTIGSSLIRNLSTWTGYTPVLTSSSGTVTSYTVNAIGCRYWQFNKIVFFKSDVQITNNGTGSGAIRITLPTTAESAGDTVVDATESNLSGAIPFRAVIPTGTNYVSITKALDNSYPGAAGVRFTISGWYETAIAIP